MSRVYEIMHNTQNASHAYLAFHTRMLRYIHIYIYINTLDYACTQESYHEDIYIIMHASEQGAYKAKSARKRGLHAAKSISVSFRAPKLRDFASERERERKKRKREQSNERG